MFEKTDVLKAGGALLGDGVIVGVNHSTQQGISFLYANGAFKVISIPNSFLTNVSGIPPGGLIVGMTNLNGNQSGWRGFTATAINDFSTRISPSSCNSC